MKKKLILSFCLLFSLAVIVLFQVKKMDTMQAESVFLNEKVEVLQAECIKLSAKITELETANMQLTKQIEESANPISEGWQPFHGWWTAVTYYTADGMYECWKEIKIYEDYIRMSGDVLTDTPGYHIAARIRGDVVEAIQELGIEEPELIEMLQAECYSEVDFSATDEWNREFLKREIDLMQNVKYYPITNDVMICISANEDGRVYVLHRIGY